MLKVLWRTEEVFGMNVIYGKLFVLKKLKFEEILKNVVTNL